MHSPTANFLRRHDERSNKFYVTRVEYRGKILLLENEVRYCSKPSPYGMAINPVAWCGLKRWPGNISRMAILLSRPWRCLVKQFHKSLCLSVAALMFWHDSAMMEFLILG
ncbi:hypothetical protein P5673_019470 [Acropora cervicornis]|uniref:Uncharacterized protein n=1 Tax=Acropora cervicornis TaxID=6130 RepID=A0AAD9V1Y8_ACRCE|nr:hypothetical protein P5673_019470 [Acropora cervicornis]